MFKITYRLLLLLIIVSSLVIANEEIEVKLVVLGVAQDAGYPQLNCYKPHCIPAWKNIHLKQSATSLAIIDSQNHSKYLFEATPDIRQQMYQLHQLAPDNSFTLSGIFLTHAHIGHYTGLMHMGREAAGTKSINVFAMPEMKNFLENNGPWSQLVSLKNIVLMQLQNNTVKKLSSNLSIKPVLVPHRDEYSETVGYYIYGPNKTVLFIPDIDKWQKWNLDIIYEIAKVDYALLDATFYKNGEIPNRDMNDIPHPFVEESMTLFDKMPNTDKKKVYFIHFNHTNPLLQKNSTAQQEVLSKGFNFTYTGMEIRL